MARKRLGSPRRRDAAALALQSNREDISEAVDQELLGLREIDAASSLVDEPRDRESLQRTVHRASRDRGLLGQRSNRPFGRLLAELQQQDDRR
jgi:hypothetical protein